MPKRKHKKYNRPKKLYDKAIIKEENNLITKYGLKNRREVWRADYAIGRIRRIAKTLIAADEDKKNEFIERQKNKGFNVETIADVLALSKEDYLKRRLQSIVVTKKFATTHKQARQFITHKHVLLNGKYIDAPSHLTTLKEESSINIDLKLPEKKQISDAEKEILNKLKPKEDQNE